MLNIMRLSIYDYIHMTLALIVVIWLNYGVFTFTTPYIPNYIRWGIFAAWFGLALIGNRKFAKTFVFQCWPLLIFYFYMLVMSFFVENDLNVYIKSVSYLIMAYSIFLYYFNNKYRSFQKVLVVLLFLDCTLIAVNTYYQLQINPLIARYLSMGVNSRENLLGESVYYGVGNYGYFYALVSIILLLSFLFLNYRKVKMLSLLLIFASSFLLVKAAFTTAILLTFIFVALLIILKYTKKNTLVIAILGVVTVLIFQGTIASMLNNLADIDGIPYEVSIRFNEIAFFISGNDVSGTDLNTRKELYSQSIKAFTNNMLFGTTVADSTEYNAGGHSAWLDLLAQFGLLSIPFFVFLFKAYKYCKNKVPLNFRPFVNVYWLYFISLGSINTLLFSNIYTIWFLFLPMAISSFFETGKKYRPENGRCTSKGAM